MDWCFLDWLVWGFFAVFQEETDNAFKVLLDSSWVGQTSLDFLLSHCKKSISGTSIYQFTSSIQSLFIFGFLILLKLQYPPLHNGNPFLRQQIILQRPLIGNTILLRSNILHNLTQIFHKKWICDNFRIRGSDKVDQIGRGDESVRILVHDQEYKGEDFVGSVFAQELDCFCHGVVVLDVFGVQEGCDSVSAVSLSDNFLKIFLIHSQRTL